MSIINEITNNTKKGMNMKIVYAIIILSLGVLGYFIYPFLFAGNTETVIQENPYTVKKGDIRISLASEGTIVGDDIVDLNFQVSDVVNKIYYNPGDKVKKGEVLAVLDSLLLQINVDKAEIALESIKTQGSVDIDNAKIALETAKNNLNLVKMELQSDTGSNYSLLQDQDDQILVAEKNKIMTQIGQVLNVIESTLYDSDLLLGVSTSNASQNDMFEIYLSAKNSSLKNNATTQWFLTNKLYTNFKNNWKLFRQGTDIDNVEEYLSQAIELAKSTTQLAQNILDVLKASVISENFTETTMVNYISQFEGIIALLKKHTSDLNITEQNMLLTQASSNIKLGTLVNDLNSKLFTAENEYKKAQMAYDTLVSTSNDLSIKLAEKNLLEAQKRLSYSKLKAPADGVILSLNGHEGEIVGGFSGLPFIQLAIDSDKYIEAYVEGIDVLKIFNEQEVMITLDTIEGLSFTGTVFFVSSAGEEDSNGITEYKVLIFFDNQDERIKNGMSVSIDYITKEVNDVVVVPVKAVIPYNNTPHVKMENNEYVEVLPGFTDGKMVEILTGLNKGDVILVAQ